MVYIHWKSWSGTYMFVRLKYSLGNGKNWVTDGKVSVKEEYWANQSVYSSTLARWMTYNGCEEREREETVKVFVLLGCRLPILY